MQTTHQSIAPEVHTQTVHQSIAHTHIMPGAYKLHCTVMHRALAFAHPFYTLMVHRISRRDAQTNARKMLQQLCHAVMFDNIPFPPLLADPGAPCIYETSDPRSIDPPRTCWPWPTSRHRWTPLDWSLVLLNLGVNGEGGRQAVI